MDGSAFHAGEQALQARTGVRERLEAVGRAVVRDHMPEAHRELFGKLPTLLLAVQDDSGQPWATMLHGPAGFVSSPDARTLRVQARPAVDDPAAPWLVAGAAVGLLGLEPHTRRRNRANGRVRTLHDDGFEVQVLQSFGNCPKYIHARRPEPVALPRARPAQRLGPLLDAASIELLRRADTLFIASASGQRPGASRADGVDVSHRGGLPGFVRVDSGPRGLRLTMPDYVGNFFFNTLGNLMAWPQAGLLVPDFEDGSLLQLAAQASIVFDAPALAAFPGAQRLLQLDLLQGWRQTEVLALRWSAPEAPPQFAP
ncbi:pyridoxamine 5'-phosphate oxidase family protein [uncultured Piscinibacter sp.]|uniref:pyridoxamine 5'-phosphate oxidase family protein n=1 Tax=uncultured Piscinibacter sp. TaxID=1131835 RepID=UPI002634F96F|nr:pyridoxamine 5'-phosphate oxidase family protein [uncultured Piscinibacter sp.]